MSVKKLSKLLLFALMILIHINLKAQKICYNQNEQTGGIERIFIQNDTTHMNWILTPDGSQYEWIGENYGWGLGDLTIISGIQEIKKSWNKPVSKYIEGENSSFIYDLGEIEISVKRKRDNNNLIEEFEFRNKTNSVVELKNIAINTPFNDNYPDAETCYYYRTNTHIWAGKHNAYINALRMGAFPPHLGLVLTEGNINGYEQRERSAEKGMSNTRGVILLNPGDTTLSPNSSCKISWTLFTHNGQEDFYKKLISYGSIAGSSEKYIYEKGEKAKVIFEHNGNIQDPVVYANGKKITSSSTGNKIIAEYPANTLGKLTFTLQYDQYKSTDVECLVISGEKELIEKRVNFIIDRQQFSSTTDSRDGAYLVYDNELDQVYLNEAKRSDCDEGRERVGMGVLLAMQYQKTKDEKILQSLLKYYDFVRKLQREDYTTFSTVDHNKSKDRAYNYPWVASFYFELFKGTGNKQYLIDGYSTLKTMYKRHGYNFYAIDTPVKGYNLLKNNGLEKEAELLLEDFKKNADHFLKNGWHFPKSEVNYEQAIIGPSIVHMLRVYRITGEQKYFDGAKELMPLLESFGGFQPSYFMNEIAIRHWDGYWFGKYRFWGDTFVHYWSTITASAYSLYYQCTGEESYQKRAENIVRNNLCQFFENGKASCVFIYPNKIDGENAHLFDPYANDQDWAIVFYYYVMDLLD